MPGCPIIARYVAVVIRTNGHKSHPCSWQKHLEVRQLKYHFRDYHTTLRLDRGELVAYHFRSVIQMVMSSTLFVGIALRIACTVATQILWHVVAVIPSCRELPV
jgi:hypothetical protein